MTANEPPKFLRLNKSSSFRLANVSCHILPAVVSDWAFEAGVCDFDGWAVVHFGGKDGSVLSIGLVLLRLGGVLMRVLSDWLADDSFSDDGRGKGLDVLDRLNISSWLSVRDCLVSVVDDASVVFADARVWGVNGLRDLADGSVS